MPLSNEKMGLLVLALLGMLVAVVSFAPFLNWLSSPPPLRRASPEEEAAMKANRERLYPSREFTVHVTDGQGRPLGDAEVILLAEYDRVGLRGLTDSAGRWGGRVPADFKNWSIFAYKDNIGFDYALPMPRPGSRAEMLPLPKEIQLTLDGARSLRVKTVDHRGKPVAGVRVGIGQVRKPGRAKEIFLTGTYSPTLPDANAALWPTTDENGVAELDWLPKRFESALPLLIHSSDYFTLDKPPSLRSDHPVEELTITLLPLENLSGRVIRADGLPCEGVRINTQGQGASPRGMGAIATTDANGLYTMRVHSEHAYIVTAQVDGRWAAPCRTGIIVRAGKPVKNVDFVLGPATRLHGRITIGKEEQPASGIEIVLEINAGEIPAELRRPNDRTPHILHLDVFRKSDIDGRYFLFLGPGEYQLKTQRGGMKPVKITIPADNPPAEIVRDLHVDPPPSSGQGQE